MSVKNGLFHIEEFFLINKILNSSRFFFKIYQTHWINSVLNLHLFHILYDLYYVVSVGLIATPAKKAAGAGRKKKTVGDDEEVSDSISSLSDR